MSKPPTLETLALAVEHQAAELSDLRERLEDLEDLRDLHEAIARNTGQAMHTWEDARRKLGLTDEELTSAADESLKDGQSTGY